MEASAAAKINDLILVVKIESEKSTSNPDLCWDKAKDTSAVNFPDWETMAARYGPAAFLNIELSIPNNRKNNRSSTAMIGKIFQFFFTANHDLTNESTKTTIISLLGLFYIKVSHYLFVVKVKLYIIAHL